MSTNTAEPTVAGAPFNGRHEVMELDVSGMTCGSCAARVQRALSRQPGVSEALVNFATARASIEFEPGAAGIETLVGVVEKAGYGASPVPAGASEHARAIEALEESEEREQSSLRARILVAVPLA